MVLCVHWFNPLVWVMYVLANRDIELSCDEAVVRLFGENTKAAYARTLISMEETRSGLAPLCNNFSKNAIEERITAIMKMKKTSIAAVLLAAVLVCGLSVGFATSAAEQPEVFTNLLWGVYREDHLETAFLLNRDGTASGEDGQPVDLPADARVGLAATTELDKKQLALWKKRVKDAGGKLHSSSWRD